MPSPKEQNKVPGLELGLPGLATGRKGRRDQRGDGQVVSYLDETGLALAWTGDEEAPYVKIVPQLPRVRNLIPSNAALVPELQAFVGPGRAIEIFAVDLRDQTQSPPVYYLQAHDSKAAPVAGATPAVTALPLCQAAMYEWTDTAQTFTQGLWVTISSTPLTYTPVVANQQFSITARVVP